MTAWLGETVELPRWAMIAIVLGLLVIIGVLLTSQRRASMHVALDAVPAFPESAEAVASLTGSILVPGNAVRVVHDGAFFDELIADIEQATLHVHIETYIWGNGEVSDRVSAALLEAARRGAQVRVVMDAVGGRAGLEELDVLREAGGEVVQFRPMGVDHWHSQNYRDHRKLVVVDGRVAWVMGHGFADEWLGSGQDEDHWRDTALRMEGPVVTRLQSEFARAWMSASGVGFVDPTTTEPQPARGDAAIHVVASSLGQRVSSVAVLFELAVKAARQELVISTPYFVPSAHIVEAIEDAAKRGVRVRLLVPGDTNDSRTVRHATHALLPGLLEAGVLAWENDEVMVHQKIMVVDGLWSHVGSTNMDMRSLEMSEEMSVGVLDAATAAELTLAFERDLARSTPITRQVLDDRSAWHRFIDWVALLGRDQL